MKLRTITEYQKRLKKIKDKFDVKRISKMCGELKPVTSRNYLVALIWFHKQHESDLSISHFLRMELLKYQRIYDSTTKTQIKNENEKTQWCEYRTLMKNAKIKDEVLFSIYNSMPPLRAGELFQICYGFNLDHCGSSYDPISRQLFIEDHKNSDLVGRKVILVSDEVSKAIHKQHFEFGEFVVKGRSRSGIHEAVKQMFGVGCRMLRKIYVSEYNEHKHSYAHRANICATMGHSIKTHLKEYVKI